MRVSRYPHSGTNYVPGKFWSPMRPEALLVWFLLPPKCARPLCSHPACYIKNTSVKFLYFFGVKGVSFKLSDGKEILIIVGGRWVLITSGDNAEFLVVEGVETEGADEGTRMRAGEASSTDAETWSSNVCDCAGPFKTSHRRSLRLVGILVIAVVKF